MQLWLVIVLSLKSLNANIYYGDLEIAVYDTSTYASLQSISRFKKVYLQEKSVMQS